MITSKLKVYEKFNLISMACWTYKEIMCYQDIKSRATAIKLKNRAIKEFDGSVQYGSQYVKTESFLQLLGTTRKKEIEILSELIRNETKLQESNI